MQHEEESAAGLYVNIVTSRFARYKETGHLDDTSRCVPFASKGTVTNVFNWPATDAVYAAITCKVKNKPSEKPSSRWSVADVVNHPKTND